MKKVALITLFLILFSLLAYATSLDYSKDYIFQTDDFILRISIVNLYLEGDVLKLEFISRRLFYFVPFMSTFTDNFGNDSVLIVREATYTTNPNTGNIENIEREFSIFPKLIFGTVTLGVIPITHFSLDLNLAYDIDFLPINPNLTERKLKIAYVVDEELKFFETTIELATK